MHEGKATTVDSKKKNPSKNNNNNNKHSNQNQKSGYNKKTGQKTGQTCLLHGANSGHDTDHCRTLGVQAKRMKATYAAQTPIEKNKLKEKHELNSMIQTAVVEALKAEKSNKRKVSFAELNTFKNLSVKDTDDCEDSE